MALAPSAEFWILIVDDDVDARAAIMELMEDGGYDVLTARNGLEALEILRSGIKPRALLVDMHMPLMDGETFCRECDTDPNLVAIPRIVISADVRAFDRLDACRARYFVKKPIVPEELFGALGSVAVLPSHS